MREQLFVAAQDAHCVTIQTPFPINAWLCRSEGVFASSDSTVYVVPYATAKTEVIADLQNGIISEHNAVIADIMVSEDGTRVIVASDHGIVYVIDVQLKVTLRILQAFSLGFVAQLVILPDGGTLIEAVGEEFDERGELRFWDITRGIMIRRVEVPHSLRALLFSPKGRLIWVDSSDAWIDLAVYPRGAHRETPVDPSDVFRGLFGEGRKAN
jgi:WD40 repeat protein